MRFSLQTFDALRLLFFPKLKDHGHPMKLRRLSGSDCRNRGWTSFVTSLRNLFIRSVFSYLVTMLQNKYRYLKNTGSVLRISSVFYLLKYFHPVTCDVHRDITFHSLVNTARNSGNKQTILYLPYYNYLIRVCGA